ncbi:helix-turn-helix domain-containing protein [Levilactobacillus brevis]|uniref:helix-turn-helix domain-containing protein n=1 Tax=Levilactobacillus brevis TaxID=1580 RepID=UPI0035A374DC
MIRNNLAVILTEKQIRISKMANDTGISRTTLTALSQNTNKMVQMGTINSVCMYLGTDPTRFFEYLPFDFDFNFQLGDIDKEHSKSTGSNYSFRSAFFINISENNKRVETIEFSGFTDCTNKSTHKYDSLFNVTDQNNMDKLTPYLERMSLACMTDVKRDAAKFINDGTLDEITDRYQVDSLDVSTKISFSIK